MKAGEEKIKILHLTSRLAEKEDLLQVFGEEKVASEKRMVTRTEDFKRAIQKEIPDVILVDHTTCYNYTAEALAILKQNEWDLPVILLIDTESEQEAISLFSEGVDDYIFLDRPNRLPISVRKIRKKYFFQKFYSFFLKYGSLLSTAFS